jgi:hypothetical protein
MQHIPGRFLALTALCLLLASCAQTGPPLPPSLELPKPPADLRASRKGNRVVLNWSEPELTTDRQSARYIGPTLVCRSLDPEITSCGNPAALLPAPPAVAQKSNISRKTARKPGPQPPIFQTYTDTLSGGQPPDPSAELTYAVEVLNRNARGAGLSNRVRVPAVMTLAPPSDPVAQVTDDGVILSWTSIGEPHNVPVVPSTNSPGVQFRYRIYRRDESSGKDAIAGEVPLGDPGPEHFSDSSFEWEKTYLYRITAVSIVKRPDGAAQVEREVQVEGDDTAPVRVIAHDVFPPSVPTGLQAVYSGEGQKPFIDLIWAPVTNSDLAGYNIYRSETGGPAIKLNADLVKSPSYRDSAVASGTTYSYSVSAVDARGNESQRSEETSESVP